MARPRLPFAKYPLYGVSSVISHMPVRQTPFGWSSRRKPLPSVAQRRSAAEASVRFAASSSTHDFPMRKAPRITLPNVVWNLSYGGVYGLAKIASRTTENREPAKRRSSSDIPSGPNDSSFMLCLFPSDVTRGVHSRARHSRRPTHVLARVVGGRLRVALRQRGAGELLQRQSRREPRSEEADRHGHQLHRPADHRFRAERRADGPGQREPAARR